MGLAVWLIAAGGYGATVAAQVIYRPVPVPTPLPPPVVVTPLPPPGLGRDQTFAPPPTIVVPAPPPVVREPPPDASACCPCPGRPDQCSDACCFK